MPRPPVSRRQRSLAVALLALFALVAGACGGDDGDGEGGSATEGAAEGSTDGTGTDGTGSDGTGGEGSAGGEGDGGEPDVSGALADALAGASGAAGNSWLTGSWEGTYTCAQGDTPLRLTLLDVGDGPVEGFFEFGTEGGEPSGAYRLRGDNTDGSLTLEGLDWIDQPDGYGMVGIEADVSGDSGNTLSGAIVGAGCESFAVERVSSDPWYVGTWRGGYICAQGRTDMTMTLEAVAGNGVEALFEFYAAAENPDVPSGSYRLAGVWADGGIQLEGVEWVERPPGYGMVDIASNPDLAIGPDLLAGRVDDPTCEQFIMERAEA